MIFKSTNSNVLSLPGSINIHILSNGMGEGGKEGGRERDRERERERVSEGEREREGEGEGEGEVSIMRHAKY